MYEPDYGRPARPPGTTFAVGLLACLALCVVVTVAALAIRYRGETPSRQAGGQASQSLPTVRFDGITMEMTYDGQVFITDRRFIREFFFWTVIILYAVCVILMMAWVAKDCRNRGIDGGAMWVLIVLLTGILGLLVYMGSRPYGILGTCQHCQNRCLTYAKACPHCGRQSPITAG